MQFFFIRLFRNSGTRSSQEYGQNVIAELVGEGTLSRMDKLKMKLLHALKKNQRNLNTHLMTLQGLLKIIGILTFIVVCSCAQNRSAEGGEVNNQSSSADSLVYDTAPRWSKSGNQILFYTYRHDSEGAELYTIEPVSKKLKRITNTYYNEWWSDFSVIDERIFFSSDKGKSSRFGGSEIFSMKADGSDVKQLTMTTDTTLFLIDPDVSPNGAKVAYCYDCIGKETNSEIYIMNTDGSDPINLTNHPSNDRNPSWSPNGEKLLFSSDRSGNYELYVLDIASGELTQITESSSNATQGDWSINDEVVFVSDEDGDKEIIIMKLDGSNRKQLTNNTAQDVLPAWSPDGLKIAFSSYRRGNMDKGDIYMVNGDGTGEELLTK